MAISVRAAKKRTWLCGIRKVFEEKEVHSLLTVFAPFVQLSMEGEVEEDVYNCSIPWHRPLCTWATLLTDPNRLFPGSTTRLGKGGDIHGRPSSLHTLANLCDEFPELVSGWPGGMLLRYLNGGLGVCLFIITM